MRGLSVLLALIVVGAAAVALARSGEIGGYRPHAGLYLRAEADQVQASLGSSGFYAALFAHARGADCEDPADVLARVVGSYDFPVTVNVTAYGLTWTQGSAGVGPRYEREFEVSLPDGARVRVHITVWLPEG